MIDRFVDPYYLLLLLLLPPLVWWYAARSARTLGAVRYSAVGRLLRADRRRTGRWRHLLFGLRLLALALMLVAFARPQTGVTAEDVATDGIDIVLVLDLSSSMLAEDRWTSDRVGSEPRCASGSSRYVSLVQTTLSAILLHDRPRNIRQREIRRFMQPFVAVVRRVFDCTRYRRPKRLPHNT
jgi:predicted acyltransferase